MSKKKYIKLILYFLPVIIHMIFTVIDKKLQYAFIAGLKHNIIYTELFFYLCFIPFYLILNNLILNKNEDCSIYKNDIKLAYLSILSGNVFFLIYNFICQLNGFKSNFNYLIEFIVILLNQSIIFGILSFLGMNYIKFKSEKESEDEIKEDIVLKEDELDLNK